MKIVEKMLELNDGIKLYVKIFDGNNSRWLIATHGIGEHLGRNSFLPETFSDQYNVLQYDLRGHGKSAGKRAYVDNFEQYVSDLRFLVEYCRREFRMSEYVLFGHSMGALITLSYVHAFNDAKKVFLSALPLELAGLQGRLVKLIPAWCFKLLGNCPLGVSLRGMVDLNQLSNDPLVKVNYLNDPLNCLKLHTRLLFGMIYQAKIASKFDISCPVMGAAGEQDGIIRVEAQAQYFKRIAGKMQIFSPGRHELHNELSPTREQYLAFLRSSMTLDA